MILLKKEQMRNVNLMPLKILIQVETLAIHQENLQSYHNLVNVQHNYSLETHKLEKALWFQLKSKLNSPEQTMNQRNRLILSNICTRHKR